LIRLRAKTLPLSRLRALAQSAGRSSQGWMTLLLNGNLELARELELDGVHLPATELLR
jgi:thiamine monophosphate synthase